MVIGVVVGAGMALTTGEALTIGASAIAGALGALVPDIDHMNSKAGRRLLPISFAVQATFGHRTITHSLLFVLACFLLANEVQHMLAWSAFAGVVSHIVADGLTARGVPLLYPLPIRFRAPLIWRLTRWL